MKCQSLFSWENKKNIISLLSADFALRVFKCYLKQPIKSRDRNVNI